jgi:50S ribosomal subunit-associated GTPase HflX
MSTKDKSAPSRLDDLEARLSAAGAIVVARIVQRRGVSRTRSAGGFKNSPDIMSPATVLGPGKTDELVQAVKHHNASLVFFLNSLKSSQAKRLSSLTGCPVVASDALTPA